MHPGKLGLVLAIGLLVTSSAQAQLSFNSAIALGGPGNDQGERIAVDAAGNIYVTGTHSGPVDFDPGPGNVTVGAAGPFNAFVAKYSPSGALIWARNQPNGVANSYTLAVDGSGNVYTAGWFNGTCDFDPGPGTTNLTAVSGPNMFVSKLDSAGNFVWAKPMLGGTATPESMAVDAAGNVWICGYLWMGSVDFDPGPGAATLVTTGNQLFLLKLDSVGNMAGIWNFLGTQALNGCGLALDAAGNVYMTANFTGTVDLDLGAGSASFTASIRDPFVIKLTSTGAFVWAKQFKGGIGAGFGTDIALDAAGNIYCTGYFTGTMDFDPGAGTTNLTAAGGGTYDTYVVKLDPAGNFVWARGLGGVGEDRPSAIAVDGASNVYVIGYYGLTEPNGDFDPGPGVFNLTPNGSYDVFISMLDGNGNFKGAVSIGAANWDQGNHIAVTPGGAVYATGYFELTADFNPGPGTANLTSAGGQDIFVIGLQGSGAGPGAGPSLPPISSGEGNHNDSRGPSGNEGCYGFGGMRATSGMLQGPFVNDQRVTAATPHPEMIVFNTARSMNPGTDSTTWPLLVLTLFAVALGGVLAARAAAS